MIVGSKPHLKPSEAKKRIHWPEDAAPLDLGTPTRAGVSLSLSLVTLSSGSALFTGSLLLVRSHDRQQFQGHFLTLLVSTTVLNPVFVGLKWVTCPRLKVESVPSKPRAKRVISKGNGGGVSRG